MCPPGVICRFKARAVAGPPGYHLHHRWGKRRYSGHLQVRRVKIPSIVAAQKCNRGNYRLQGASGRGRIKLSQEPRPCQWGHAVNVIDGRIHTPGEISKHGYSIDSTQPH